VPDHLGPPFGHDRKAALRPGLLRRQRLDVQFTTTIAGRESTLEIDVTDPAVGRTDYKSGTYTVGRHTGFQTGASVWVTPDQDVDGYPGGWYTDAAGSSGSVTLAATPGGTVNNVVAVPKHGSGSLTVRGTFRCH
jgi:hypothetical protein